MRAQLGLSGGQLIANPIPKEDEPRDVNPLIEKAIREAEAKAITAKEVTPFAEDHFGFNKWKITRRKQSARPKQCPSCRRNS